MGEEEIDVTGRGQTPAVAAAHRGRVLGTESADSVEKIWLKFFSLNNHLRPFFDSELVCLNYTIGHDHSVHVPPEFFQSTKIFYQPKLPHTWLGQD